MPWVKIDDHFTDHPKIHLVGAIGIALQVRMLCFCSRNLTDGRFTLKAVEPACADVQAIEYEMTQGHADTIAGVTRKWVERMVEAGIWEEMGGGEYVIHDYSQYQPSKAQILEQRALNAQKQASHRRRSQDSHPGSNPVTNASPRTRTRTTGKKDLLLLDPVLENFEEYFWTPYPRKASKPRAEKAFRALTTERKLPPLEELRRAVLWHREHGCLRESKIQNGEDYRPYPEAFLNAHRWKDVPKRKETEERPTDEPNRLLTPEEGGIA